jgi:ABC-type nitrate/sulfonate/bicarbonate transport system permease component
MGAGWRKTLLSLTIFIVVWELAARLSPYPRTIFPAFTDVVRTFLSVSYLSLLARNYLYTAARALAGFLLGLFAGIGTGIASFTRKLGDYVQPVATLLFTVPSVAWIPLLIVWIGLKDFSLPIAASFLCSFPPVLYGMINSYRTIDKEQVDVAMALGAKPNTILWKIVLPQSILKILPLIKTEAVMTWKTVFVAEMVALSSGLGYLAMLYASTIETALLISVITVLSLTTLLIILFFDWLEKNLSSRWMGGGI